MLTRASSLLHGCHSPVRDRVSSPVIGREVLRVAFDQSPLPFCACPAPVEVTAEASESHVGTANLFTACTGIHSSAQKQPKVVSLSPLCSSQT